MDTELASDTVKTPPKNEKNPPIKFEGKTKHEEMCPYIKSILNHDNFIIKYCPDKVMVLVNTLVDHARIMSTIKEGQNVHTFTPKSQRKNTFVLTGLVLNLSEKQVREELIKKGVEVDKCFRMKDHKRHPLHGDVPTKLHHQDPYAESKAYQ